MGIATPAPLAQADSMGVWGRWHEGGMGRRCVLGGGGVGGWGGGGTPTTVSGSALRVAPHIEAKVTAAELLAAVGSFSKSRWRTLKS